MRLPPRARASTFFLSTAFALALLAACGGGAPGNPDGGQACAHDKDCPAGQQCANRVCAALPCGGCQADQACSASGACVTAQGANCAGGSNLCPTDYPCNGQICARTCTLDTDCDPGTICNSNLKSCTQCAFDSQCKNVPGKAWCNGATGQCVACNVNIDCTSSLGAGHVCQSHACIPGCLTSNDCNASNGEHCDGASGTTPGRCIQCSTFHDCGSALPACDATGHCVGCAGANQAAANAYCGPGSPECNLATQTCVQCLPANDQSGFDCGVLTNIPSSGDRDPHDATTCDPVTFKCVPGCKFESQCGCPRRADGSETGCADPDGTTFRNPGQEHCDPARTSMAGFAGATEGACVQCRVGTNADCYSQRTGNITGERCVNDACVPGCDADVDCTSGYVCHLGNDANNHKCVQCSCAGLALQDGNAYCQDGVHCPGTANGSPEVCDAATLLCRKKRSAETCTANNECGDQQDPAVANDRCIPDLFCALDYHPTTGNDLFCNPDKHTGKCAVACQSVSGNDCGDGSHCPANTLCRQADSVSGSSGTPHCVANSCDNP